MKTIFSQSLQKQALIAMFIGVLPILTLTLWYAQALSQNQQHTQAAYNQNQALILEFNAIKGDVIAIEKALQNNELLQSEALQRSIEQKWQNTQTRLQSLQASLPSSTVVAKLQQSMTQNLSAQATATNLQQLITLLNQQEPNFQQSLKTRLAQQENRFSELQTVFVFGLVLLLPTLVAISIFLIHRICQQLNQVGAAVAEVGKGNLDKTVELKGSFELGQLNDRLNWLRLELKRVQQQKETFLRHVTHELKTPLASLNEGSSLLGSSLLGPVNQKQQRIITIMADAVTKLGSLIDDLLSYSAASHPDSLHHEAQLSEIKAELLSHLEDKIQQRQVHLNWYIDDHCKLPYLPCKLVLTQLINNAIEHANSKIDVEIKQSQQQFSMLVHDDGAGIDSSQAQAMFQPFVRGSNNKTVNGSGLGLAIVSECVKQLKGTVTWLNVRHGACIQVTFPTKKTS